MPVHANEVIVNTTIQEDPCKEDATPARSEIPKSSLHPEDAEWVIEECMRRVKELLAEMREP